MPFEQARAIELLKRIHLFRGVDEQTLNAAIGLMEVAELPAGMVIFTEGKDPDYFFFIYSGLVHLSRIDRELRQSISLGFLDEGDYFGQEVLEAKWPRQLSAVTETDAVLMRLSATNFAALLKMAPVLGQRLQFILDIYHLMLRTRFSWIDADETIYYVARRHILFLWNRLLPPIFLDIVLVPILTYLFLSMPGLRLLAFILLVLLAIGTVLWELWFYIDWTNDYFVVTNKRVLDQEKVILLYDSRQESPIEAVQSTSISTSQLGRILGYGNVAIRTYIGTILFRDVNKPEMALNLIQEQQARSQTSRRRSELRDMGTIITRKIYDAQGSNRPPLPGPPPPQPSPLQRFISDMLHMRYEVGGTVLYRTHWFVLVKKVGIQVLLLIGMAILFMISWQSQFAVLSLQTVCLFNVVAATMIMGWGLYQYIDWHNDIYLITPDQIVDINKKPLGREERRAAPIKNILSIEYKRLGLIGLLFNYGTVYIRVGDQQLAFDDVLNPAEVQRELFEALARRNLSDRQAQIKSEHERMSDWIATYHRIAHSDTPPPDNLPTR